MHELINGRVEAWDGLAIVYPLVITSGMFDCLTDAVVKLVCIW